MVGFMYVIGHVGPVQREADGGEPAVGCWPVGWCSCHLPWACFWQAPPPWASGVHTPQPGCLHCCMDQLMDVGVPLLASHSNHYLVSLICDFSGTFIHLLEIETRTILFCGFKRLLWIFNITIITFIFYANTRTVFRLMWTPVPAI